MNEQRTENYKVFVTDKMIFMNVAISQHHSAAVRGFYPSMDVSALGRSVLQLISIARVEPK